MRKAECVDESRSCRTPALYLGVGSPVSSLSLSAADAFTEGFALEDVEAATHRSALRSGESLETTKAEGPTTGSRRKVKPEGLWKPPPFEAESLVPPLQPEDVLGPSSLSPPAADTDGRRRSAGLVGSSLRAQSSWDPNVPRDVRWRETAERYRALRAWYLEIKKLGG